MKMDEYLGRFRGVEPPRELRARVLERARGRLRDGSRDGWILGVAALVLVLLTAVNVHLEGRVRALTNGDHGRKVAPDGQLELVDPFQSPLRSRLAVRRTRKVGEQSWLKLRVDLERIKRIEG